MKAVIDGFAGNRVAANLLMLFIITAGLLTLPTLRKETFPAVDLDRIVITVAYPGAGPVEIESAICRRLEEALGELDGFRQRVCVAQEGAAVMALEVAAGFDTGRLRDQVTARVEAMTGFPDDAERPVIREVAIRNRVLNVVVYGDADQWSLRRLAEKVRDDLLAIDGITRVELVNARPYEIAVEVSDQALYAYDLSFAEVADSIRRSSVNMAGGEIKAAGGDVLTRVAGQVLHGDEFAALTVRARPDGSVVTVGDVAVVRDGFAETENISTYNGHPGILLTVYRVGNQSILDISRQVHAYVAASRDRLPEGVALDIWQDRSRMFASRLSLLLNNAAMGLALVFGLLVLFLRLRLAFWVSAGIAVSFFGTLWLLPLLGGSINMISMFAFVLVLGIVVDDAIIVGESIFSRHRQGRFGLDAARAGTHDVARPVTFAALTSIIAFLPIVFLPGVQGKLWDEIAIVVIVTLCFSLLESLLILPAHLSTVQPARPPGSTATAWLSRCQDRLAGGFERAVLNRYRPFLTRVLYWRYATAAGFAAVFVLAVSMVLSGWVPMVFFPRVEGDSLVAAVRFPQGTGAERTQAAIERLSRAARAVKAALRSPAGVEEIRSIVTTLGAQPLSRTGLEGGHVAEVALELAPAELRRTANPDILRRWRQAVGDIPDAVELSFHSRMVHRAPDLHLELSGYDQRMLTQAARQLERQLRDYTGVYAVQDSLADGKREAVVSLEPVAVHAGLSLAELGSQVRQAFFGVEVQQVLRGRDVVRVVVRLPEDRRRSLAALENLPVRLPSGTLVPLTGIARIGLERGPSEIRRVDGRRVVTVTARVDSASTTTRKVMDDLRKTFLRDLARHYPGVDWRVGGSQKDRSELIDAMVRGFILAVIGIYALIAVSFRSYVQPLIVVSAVPFGLIGAIGAHFAFGLDISLLSLSGMIAVSGVVVNDNLVLVEYINRVRRRGKGVIEAVSEAAAARFRPVILTSLTTFAGLTPLMLERSVQAQFLIPMAVSLAFGVMFATLVSLILVPAAYLIVEDGKALVRRQAMAVPPGSGS